MNEAFFMTLLIGTMLLDVFIELKFIPKYLSKDIRHYLFKNKVKLIGICEEVRRIDPNELQDLILGRLNEIKL